MIRLILIGIASIASGFAAAHIIAGRGVPPSPETARAPQFTPADPAEELADASPRWQDHSPVEQLALALRWGDVHDVGTIRSRLEELHRLPTDAAQETARAILLANWLALDPQGACEWCANPGPGAGEIFSESVVRWAEQDSDAAKTYARSLDHAVWAVVAISSLVEFEEGQDPAGAVELLASLPTGLRGFSRLDDSIRRLASAAPREILLLADGQSGELRARLVHAAGSELAAREPAAALEWWVEQPDRLDHLSMLRGLPSATWDEAVGIFLAQDNSSTRSLAEGFGGFKSVGESWAREDPLALLTLLDSDTGLPESDVALLAWRAVWALSESDPVAAAAWVTDRGLMAPNMASTIARNWGTADPSAAAEWVRGIADREARIAAQEELEIARVHSETRDVRPNTVAEMLPHALTAGSVINSIWFSNLPDTERARLVPTVATLPPAERDAIVARLSTELAQNHPAEASELLLSHSQIADPPAALLASAAGLATTWGNANPEAAARWVERLPEGTLRAEARSNLVAQWEHYDPDAARDWAATNGR